MTNVETDDKMKQFDIDMSKGATSNVDIIPPPLPTCMPLAPHVHSSTLTQPIYRQNPTAQQSVDTPATSPPSTLSIKRKFPQK
jgi:general transcription factor 3C polypeptide 5 (transcription factor C subunit 1)